MPSQQLTFENDVDRYGQDYRSFNLSSADPGVCQKACRDESQCRAFTYVPPGVQGSSARCYLKSGEPLARRTAGMVSGLKAVIQQSTQGTSDECGPSYVTKHIGGRLNGPFQAVCRRHDACYRERQGTQRTCDETMSREMAAICNREPFYRKGLCQFRAAFYEEAITSTYGGSAYKGFPEGEIVSVSRKVIKDTFSDDEVDYCVTIRNPSSITQEYDLQLFTSTGRLVDIEPDTHEFNVLSGRTKRACVGTNLLVNWSISDLTSEVIIVLSADTPIGISFWNDMVSVDCWKGRGR